MAMPHRHLVNDQQLGLGHQFGHCIGEGAHGVLPDLDRYFEAAVESGSTSIAGPASSLEATAERAVAIAMWLSDLTAERMQFSR